MTFALEGALWAGLEAAWGLLRGPLLVAGTSAWAIGVGYDLVQVPRGKPAWSEDLSLSLALLGIAVPGIMLFAGSQEGAVPPTAWQWAPFASLAGFTATLALKLLDAEVTNRGAVKLTVAAAVAAVLGVAWLVAPRSDVPAAADQLELDRRLQAAIPMPRCSPRPVEALPPGLLRNSLDGFVHCHRGRLQGTFMAFRSNDLLNVYASHRGHLVEERGEHPADLCSWRSGAYADAWFKESRPNHEIGALICFGKGRRQAVLQWEDPRSGIFASLQGRTRRGLFRWWHNHQVWPGFRG